MARILAVAVLVVLAAVHEAGAQRVALVIGNGAYREAPALANPAADARGMAAALTRLNFSVETVIDADRAAMERAIRRFGEAATGAEAAMVYYAGHAVEVAGRNFLIPVSAEIRSDRDLPFETIDFDAVMTQLEGRARVILIFLDACRDNPFRQRLMAGGTRGIASAGLAPVRGPVGTLVAFATAPGQVAQDGYGRNSPFTAALLAHIETPGLEVRPMLGRVRQAVREATAGAQVPWENSSLEGEFFFRPAPAAAPPLPLAALPAAPAQTPASPPRSVPEPDVVTERLFWESVKDSRSPEELRAYLRRYPDGVFSELARTRIGALERAAAPPAPPRPPETTEAARQPPAQDAARQAAAREAASRQAAVQPQASPPPPAPPPSPPAQPQQQRQLAARPPPPPPEPAPSGFPGQGGTVRILTHLVPLPAGPWREASRWVEQSNSTLGIGFRQIFPVHHVLLVQERDGRPVAAIRVMATDNSGEIGAWHSPPACRSEGSLARALVSSYGLYLDCWRVTSRPAEESNVSRVIQAGTVASSQHAVGDSRNFIHVEYAFTYAPGARVAAWAPAAHAALQRGFLGGRQTEGLPSP